MDNSAPSSAAVPPPLPKRSAVPPTPSDPTWWRLSHGIPYICLLLVAASADFFCPLFCGHSAYIGFGTALGTLLFAAALLLLRKDFTRGETVFLTLFALASAAGQAFSGSTACWIGMPIVCFVLLQLRQESDEPLQTGRSWWGFWLARRPDAATAKAFGSGCLPTVISIAVMLVLFFVFLAIFASGNPVVERAWELICEYWNKVLDFLHLDKSIWLHALTWIIGIASFGVFTLARNRVPRIPAKPAPATAGKNMLPQLPAFALLGINAAFGIATSTDIIFLWCRRIPEGISQTVYLHNGAQSIIIASVLAASLLLLLFTRNGSARRSLAAQVLGYLLVFQTALLAVSVFMRLYFQIEDFGFTYHRVLAGEFLLCGIPGIALLLSYMGSHNCFLHHLRIGFASVVLLFFLCNIQAPSGLAGDLNLCFLDSHPHWKFEHADFCGLDKRFEPADCLSFAARYMSTGDSNDNRRLNHAARSICKRFEKTNRRALTINALRFRELAAEISAANETQNPANP